jgi:hypothetical protein
MRGSGIALCGSREGAWLLLNPQSAFRDPI